MIRHTAHAIIFSLACEHVNKSPEEKELKHRQLELLVQLPDRIGIGVQVRQDFTMTSNGSYPFVIRPGQGHASCTGTAVVGELYSLGGTCTLSRVFECCLCALCGCV